MKKKSNNKKVTSSILVSLLFLVIGFATISMKPLFKNIPEGHDTLGKIPPIDYNNGDGKTVWTIINNTDCDIGVTTWFTGSINLSPSSSNLWLDFPISNHGNHIIQSPDILGLYGVTGSDILTITNISFQFYIPGIGPGGEKAIYPITGTYRWPVPPATSTGYPAPCDCLDFNVNATTKTITVQPCFP